MQVGVAAPRLDEAADSEAPTASGLEGQHEHITGHAFGARKIGELDRGWAARPQRERHHRRAGRNEAAQEEVLAHEREAL